MIGSKVTAKQVVHGRIWPIGGGASERGFTNRVIPRLSKCHKHQKQAMCKIWQDSGFLFALCKHYFVINPFCVAISCDMW